MTNNSTGIKRMGRTTCTWCSKPLGNGQALTERTVTVSERWSQNSVGFTRVPVAEHEVLAAMHAACEQEFEIQNAASKVRYWREQIDELTADNFPIPTSAYRALTEAEDALRVLAPGHALLTK
jgi:hypothetical protein